MPLPKGGEFLSNPDAKERLLPVERRSKELERVIRESEVTILVGETGSGKTTVTPMIIDKVIPRGEKIIITQPRRLPVTALARYIAKKKGLKLGGNELGYAIRFDSEVKNNTRLNFMTEGILVRLISRDNLLSGYGCVMLDEAHERSSNLDFCLGLLKIVQQKRREAHMEPLKIVISSATLEKEKFQEFFNSNALIEIEGRQFPVDIEYEVEPVRDFKSRTAQKVKEIIESQSDGDILVFMPGLDEIMETKKSIESLQISGDYEIHILHSSISSQEMNEAIRPSVTRKIIIATNIAETSITIPGVKHVIDSGLIKQINYDEATGISALETVKHSKSGCVQRAGRAGRVANGHCYRLFTQDDFSRRIEHQVPELLRTSLASTILTLKKLGVDDVLAFDFPDQPKRDDIEQTISTLKKLGALDKVENITPDGELMEQLPLEPRMAKIILEANKYNCTYEAVAILALMNAGRSVFYLPRESQREQREKALQAQAVFTNPNSDYLTLLEVWDRFCMIPNGKDLRIWIQDNFLNGRVLREAENIFIQLTNILERHKIRIESTNSNELIGKAFLAGSIDNLMQNISLEESTQYQYKMVVNGNGYNAKRFISPRSALFKRRVNPALVSCMRWYKSAKGNVLAEFAQLVKAEWLVEVAPHLFRGGVVEYNYDNYEDKVFALIEVSLINSNYFQAREKRAVKEEEIAQAVSSFSSYCAKNPIYLNTGDYTFFANNEQVRSKYNDFLLRAGGKLPNGREAQRFTKADMAVFYTNLFTPYEISSISQLIIAIKDNKISISQLSLNLEAFISQSEQDEIMRLNPDSIKLNGITKQIKYSYEQNDNGDLIYIASINIDITELDALHETPILPSGRALEINLIDNNGNLITKSDDIEIIKKNIASQRAKLDWETFIETHPPEKIEIKDKFPEIGELGGPLVYSKAGSNGKVLLAYPAICLGFVSANFSIRFYKDKEEAESVHQATREKWQSKVISERIKEKIKDIKEAFNSIWRISDLGEKAKLRHQLTDAEMNEIAELFDIVQNFDLGNSTDAKEAQIAIDNLMSKYYNDERFLRWRTPLAREYLKKELLGGLGETITVKSSSVESLKGGQKETISIGSDIFKIKPKIGGVRFEKYNSVGKVEYFELEEGHYTFSSDGDTVYSVRVNGGIVCEVFEKTKIKKQLESDNPSFGDVFGQLFSTENEANISDTEESIEQKNTAGQIESIESINSIEESPLDKESRDFYQSKVEFLSKVVDWVWAKFTLPRVVKKNQLTKKEKAFSLLRERLRRIRKEISSLKINLSEVKELTDSDAKSRIGQIIYKINHLIIGVKKFIPPFNENWLDNIIMNWQEIQEAVNNNSDAQEYIRENIISGDELIERIKTKILEKTEIFFNKNKYQELNLNNIIDEVLNEI